MHILLLQVADSVANLDQIVGTVEQKSSLSLWDLALKGGFVMIPIALLSLLGVYIFFERYLTIRRADRDSEDFILQIKQHIKQAEVQKARELCQKTDTPFARMLDKGLSRLGRPLADIDKAIENVGQLEVAKLESRFGILSTVAGAAPMLGFLGTITGLILAFHDIEAIKGNVTPDVLARGIYQAMVTTAAGLMVGIPAYFGYQYLVGRVEGIIFKLEKSAQDFFDILNEPVSRQ